MAGAAAKTNRVHTCSGDEIRSGNRKGGGVAGQGVSSIQSNIWCSVIFEGANAGGSGRAGNAPLIFAIDREIITYGCITSANGHTSRTQSDGGSRAAVVL